MTARPLNALPSPPSPGPEASTHVAALVRRAQGGDEHAFAQLYTMHAPRIYATCLRLMGEPAAASDALQDAFVRVWDALPAYRGESAPATWMHRIAVNTALERLRKDARRTRRVEEIDDVDSIGASATDINVADKLDLERAIARLSAEARTVFVLRAVEGYSYGEISALTGSSEVALRAQFSRARRTLAEYLET